jgi:type I restriction-modification system DNA methylase subunit
MTETYKEYNETGDKNIFEDIIDKMILDQVAGMNETFRTAISKLPKDRKRMAILSLLDKDRNLFTKIKDSITTEGLSKIEHVKNIVLMLREYVKIAEVEKKKFGEVMTPLDLVKEMLATLPEEVWSNPDLKWLDPANGTGPFPSIVIYKLMKGLEKWQPNEELRYKHIIENMIYVCELQPKNMFLYLCTIDPRDEYQCNVYTGSFLDEGFDYHMKNVWNVEKFDIIIGNPPYQDQVGKTNTEPLWDKFVKKSFNFLINDGYLVLVHPSGWRSPKGRFKYIKDLISSNNLIYLNLNDFDAGQKTFGVGTNFDFYCVQKSVYNNKTKVIDVDNNEILLNISNLEFIPNGMFEKFLNITTSNKEEQISLIHSESIYAHRKNWMSKELTDLNIHPCVYTITKKNGINLYYSNTREKGHFGIPKVIWSNGLGTYPVLDETGIYGLMEYSFGIGDSIENLIKIKEALETKDFIDLMKYAKFTNNKYDHRVMETLKKDFWKEFINE